MSENVNAVRFIRLGMRMGYIEARKELRGRELDFPSHPLLDKHMMGCPKKYNGPESEVRLRARELFAHPGRNKVFERGDIIDPKTGWIIPHGEIPQEAFGERHVGLYFDPEIEENGGRVIVHPKLLVVCHGVKPNILGGYLGVVDDSTKIPNALVDRKGVGEEMLRSLVLLNRGGIFVITRSEFIRVENPMPDHDVVHTFRPDIKLEIVGVAKE